LNESSQIETSDIVDLLLTNTDYMLQNELKQEINKTKLQNKLILAFAGICLFSTIVLAVLLFTGSSTKTETKEQFQSSKNQALNTQVKNISEDKVNFLLELSEVEVIQKFDSLAYLIDTLQLSLVRAEANARRDYSRYVTASTYSETSTSSLEQNNLDHLIENSKKFAATDCEKALVFLYAAKKIAQIDGTSSLNKQSINQMINKCEKALFSSK